MRLADWPRNPYLNDELREWIGLHLNALHVEDVAVYAIPQGRDDEGRRVLIATEVGLLDGTYSPRGSAAHYSLQVRLWPWQAVSGVTLLAETYRLWAYEHRTWWRLRLAAPVIDFQTEDPELGCALADLGTACAVMAEPGSQREPALDPGIDHGENPGLDPGEDRFSDAGELTAPEISERIAPRDATADEDVIAELLPADEDVIAELLPADEDGSGPMPQEESAPTATAAMAFGVDETDPEPQLEPKPDADASLIHERFAPFLERR